MTTAIVPATQIATQIESLASADLTTVNGGFDVGRAIEAGNQTAESGRRAGATLGAGFDAARKVATGVDSQIGATVGPPVGAAVGWVGGAAADSYNQLRGK